MTFPPRIVDLSAAYRPGTMDAGGGNPCNQLVYHFTVSGSFSPVARNLAAQVQNGSAGGGTQAYVDDAEVVLAMPARRRAYATGSALGHNSTTYNIEICGGILHGTRGNPTGPDDAWLDPNDPAGQAFINAAWWGAKACREYEIQPRLLTVAETRDPNAPGITTHARISLADGPGGSDHIDWDDTEPVAELVALTKHFYDNPDALPAPYQEDEDMTPETIKAIADAVWQRPIKAGFSAEEVLYWANRKGWESAGALDKVQGELVTTISTKVAEALGDKAPAIDTDELAKDIVREFMASRQDVPPAAA